MGGKREELESGRGVCTSSLVRKARKGKRGFKYRLIRNTQEGEVDFGNKRLDEAVDNELGRDID